MEDKKRKLETWWWYHKNHVLLAALILAAGLYMLLPELSRPKADYNVGLVSAVPYPQETLDSLKQALTDCGEDLNGDGRVLVELHVYTVDLADSSDNAGMKNYQAAASLDADLVGKVSGLFLLEDPEAFQRSSNLLRPIEGEMSIPWTLGPGETDGRLNLAMRLEHPDEAAYLDMWSRLVELMK